MLLFQSSNLNEQYVAYVSRNQTLRYCGKYLHEKQSENWQTLSLIYCGKLYTQANINIDLNEPLINGEYSRLKVMAGLGRLQLVSEILFRNSP